MFVKLKSFNLLRRASTNMSSAYLQAKHPFFPMLFPPIGINNAPEIFLLQKKLKTCFSEHSVKWKSFIEKVTPKLPLSAQN